ncbi:MAG: hypothetical protein V4513_01460 [Pseudomonadota bacterium]
MADAFQPRFVDLVRNYTTTAGTGDFVLGPAVNGYSGFASALSVGDRFYYSAVGVDKPAEREVGRGTLLANGIVKREPVSGAKTNFTGGTKSIALIAAAEWFDAANAGIAIAAGAPRSVADRAALAASGAGTSAHLREKGREGLFVWDGTDLSAKVTSDPAQGLFIAPASDASGRSGAWVRKFDGAVLPDWFGLVRGASAGANAATNDAAFVAMWSALAALAQSTGGAKVLHAVDLGPGTIEISAPIIAPGTVKINGRGMGMSTVGGGTADCGTMVMPIGCTAFRFDYSRSSLSDLVIFGDFSTTEAEYHGVHFRQLFYGTNIRCQSMRGDGFYAEGTTSAGFLADSARLVGCEGRNCRNGFYFNGADANVIQIIGGTAHNNRQWGVWESSSLGNAYFGVELSGNGVQPANDGIGIGAAVVSHNGNWYGCIAGQEAAAALNAPSGTATDNAYWYYVKAGAVAPGFPAWTSGMSLRAGGAAYSDDSGAINGFTDCYAETNQGKAQLTQGTTVRGGMLAKWLWMNPAPNSSPNVLSVATDGAIQFQPSAKVASGSVTSSLGSVQGNAPNWIVSGLHASFGNKPYGFYMDAGSFDIQCGYNNVSTQVCWTFTGANTTQQFGTGAAFPYAFSPFALMVQGNGRSTTNARRLMIDAAAPTSGAHARGEVVFNRNAAIGAPIGWMCTAAGTPGTWAPMANL